MDQQKLAEIEARTVACAPGPWKSYVEGRDHDSGDSFIETANQDIYLEGASVEDQDFIAHARQDVPLLINEVRRLQVLLKQHDVVF